jgi:hypothetical protein
MARDIFGRKALLEAANIIPDCADAELAIFLALAGKRGFAVNLQAKSVEIDAATFRLKLAYSPSESDAGAATELTEARIELDGKPLPFVQEMTFHYDNMACLPTLQLKLIPVPLGVGVSTYVQGTVEAAEAAYNEKINDLALAIEEEKLKKERQELIAEWQRRFGSPQACKDAISKAVNAAIPMKTVPFPGFEKSGPNRAKDGFGG